MSLSAALTTIRTRLERNEFANEQAIKQGIVLRVLAELGWDTFDTTIVWPEYSVAPRRVDFALCHPAGKPAVFVEVKQPGLLGDADKQLFEYAFHEGVPLAVLTDGQTWSFYLPSGQGSYDDRRVYKLDLIERTADEAVEKLTRYLQHQRVASGEALEATQSDYRNLARQYQAKRAVPEAWKELVDAEDSRLIDLLSEATERRIGVQPKRSDLIDFFGRIRFVPAWSTDGQPVRVAAPADQTLIGALPRNGQQNIHAGSWYCFDGQRTQVPTAKRVVLGILRELERRQPGFLERCARHEGNQGNTRSYIGRRPEDLYPERPEFAADENMSAEIVPGWLLMTNFSNQVKRTILNLAGTVAGMRLQEGVDYSL